MVSKNSIAQEPSNNDRLFLRPSRVYDVPIAADFLAIRIHGWRRRMGLSLRQVSEAEWEAWVASVKHAPAAKSEEKIAAAQIGESGEDATSAGDHVEEQLPGGQFVEEPAPLSEGFWASFVEEEQL